MRRVDDADETPGGDSFLDIVANIVGILVLLVVVVGVRAGRQVFVPTPVPTEGESLEVIEQQVKDAARQAEIEKAEALELRDKVLAAAAEAERRARERAAATQYGTKQPAELDEANESLDRNDQRSLATHNAIAQAQLALDRLTREQIALASFEPPPEVETVTVSPTPIVNGRVDKTVSFRLQGGRLVYVPVNEIEAELLKQIEAPPITDPRKGVVTRERLGPIEGFLGEAQIGWSMRVVGNRIGVRPQLGQLVLREVTPLRGESAEEAFSPGVIR
ncbi:MAG: hypothetical protein AAF266_11440 [Planctomycetota bacterium]